MDVCVRFQPSAAKMIPTHTHTISGSGWYVDGLRPCQAVLFLLLHIVTVYCKCVKCCLLILFNYVNSINYLISSVVIV